MRPPWVFNTFQIANLVIYHYINGYDDVLLYVYNVYIPLYHYINVAVFMFGFTRSTTHRVFHIPTLSKQKSFPGCSEGNERPTILFLTVSFLSSQNISYVKLIDVILTYVKSSDYYTIYIYI